MQGGAITAGELKLTNDSCDANWVYAPGNASAGDIVTWDLGRGLTHIGIVSDRTSPAGVPLVLHNIGRGTQEEDILFGFAITGHYRFVR